MTADDAANEAANVGGTRTSSSSRDRLGVGCLHHVSSVAVAGEYPGLFTEEMFDEGQRLPSPYHRTKFEAERIVREQATVPWRVYRPAIVVGDSRTGRDRQGRRAVLPLRAHPPHARCCRGWLPLVGPGPRRHQRRAGRLRGRRDGSSSCTSTGPRRPRVPPREPAPAAGARGVQRVRGRRRRAAPRADASASGGVDAVVGLAGRLGAIPGVELGRDVALDQVGHPARGAAAHRVHVHASTTRATAAALEGTESTVPDARATYAPRALALLGGAPRPRPRPAAAPGRPARRAARRHHRRVVGHRARDRARSRAARRRAAPASPGAPRRSRSCARRSSAPAGRRGSTRATSPRRSRSTRW